MKNNEGDFYNFELYEFIDSFLITVLWILYLQICDMSS